MATSRKRNYAAEYARRQERAKAKGFSSYAEQRITEAVRRGKTAQEARGHHPSEKIAQRVRKGSIAHRAGASVIPKAATVWRDTFTHAGDTRKKRKKTSQVVYQLSHLTPKGVQQTFKKAIRRVQSMLYGKRDYPRVQWRMTLETSGVKYGANKFGRGVRSTGWVTVTKAGFDSQRLLGHFNTAIIYYVDDDGYPETVVKPLALYLDHV